VRSESLASSGADTQSSASLYALLAEDAPESSERGETIHTSKKETIDNDREALAPGLLDG
jgi:hypothetical protein